MKTTLIAIVLVMSLAGCMPQQDPMIRLDAGWHEVAGCISKITKNGLELTTPDDRLVTVLLYTELGVLGGLSPGQCVVVAGFITAVPEQFIGRAIRTDVGRPAVK